jgi:hypothetical protein
MAALIEIDDDHVLTSSAVRCKPNGDVRRILQRYFVDADVASEDAPLLEEDSLASEDSPVPEDPPLPGDPSLATIPP